VKLAWSKLAQRELQELRRHSVKRSGREVAQRYLEDVRDAAKLLGNEPSRAKPLKGSFRVFRVRSHCLIAHVDEAADRVTIARVLHVAMDIERHLP
jgi:plasmid stabilization system protein ParE